MSPKQRDRAVRKRGWIGAPLARMAFVAIAISLVATWTTLAHGAAGTGRSRTSSHPSTAASSTAKAKCVNSFAPACGAFHWSPQPGQNAPMTTSIAPASPSGIAGKAVSFDASAVDPDAPIACHWILFGDEAVALIPPVMLHARHGTWIPPAKQPGRFQQTYTHTYSKPGTYHVQFGARSGDGCESNYNPYGGESVATAAVTIAAS